MRMPTWVSSLMPLVVITSSKFSFGTGSSSDTTVPAFVENPRVFRVRDMVRIEFRVDRETDVAVFIENAKGKVVRHLAAGRLGPNTPTPLKPGSLTQSIEWDGKADHGMDAGPGPFKVRVGLGTKPVLADIIGQEPAGLGYPRSFAVGPSGELYVVHVYGQTHPDDNGAAIAVFSRNGRYLRTIMPYPSDLPDEKLKGLKRIELPDGKKVPFIYQIETRSYLPGLGNLPRERGVVTRDGRLAFVGILEGPRPFANPGEARLVVIRSDGSVPSSPLGPQVAWSSDSGANLALSPDEQTFYAAGLRTATHRSEPGPDTICEKCDGAGHGNTWHCTKPSHAVYKFGWSDEKVTIFVGDPEKPGDGPDQLRVPIGVATDTHGNVYVADHGNGRIAVFSPEGKPLTQWKVCLLYTSDAAD
ncbi:MAG: hypothetical protein N2255_00770, partial [Kiritimatiellae bacterium]|nr:hypothetical protein [Kiritimatiellia bacterium]